MKTIMYHYVRPAAPGLPYFPYLALADFERQLDHFAATHGFVSRAAFERWVAGGPAPEGVLLTFDDGLRDHVDFVLPLLKARGIFGLFYVPSAPILTGALLDVHKVHLILGRLGGDAALKWVRERHPGLLADVAQQQVGAYGSHQDQTSTKVVKHLFNWDLAPGARGPVLDELLAFALDGSVPDWRDLYLDESGLSALVTAGMGVGPHGHEHAILSKLDAAAQETEIRSSCELVLAASGTLDWGYCYAHGIPEAFTDSTIDIVAAAGCPFAFAVSSEDTCTVFAEAPRYSLPRHNCNEFRHGSASTGTEETGTDVRHSQRHRRGHDVRSG